ncbi:hypothetical protein OXPF_23980 [Oxobacter pfennigii]|uniref:Uncharacterized protein n=1 Tax=Oxobacter pfennigii TaxID=36849 RepID=A0A0P8YB14_9CLOT|nr:hypothetical protein OXPF_23980 [Oxobacter pfennigii]
MAFWGYGVYDNYKNYQDPFERTLIDVGVLFIGAFLGVSVGTATATATALATTVGLGIVISLGGSVIKNVYYGKKI